MVRMESFEPLTWEPPTIHPVPAESVVFRLRVELEGTPVWRLIEVPGETRLDRLHSILQVVMGWSDSHLHEFLQSLGQHPFAVPFLIEENGYGVPEADYRLDQVVSADAPTLIYQYDFGDSWVHRLTVVAVVPEAGSRARCLDGAFACPPEDIGGVHTYAAVAPWVESGFSRDLEPECIEPERMRGFIGDWRPGIFDAGAADAALDREPA